MKHGEITFVSFTAADNGLRFVTVSRVPDGPARDYLKASKASRARIASHIFRSPDWHVSPWTSGTFGWVATKRTAERQPRKGRAA